jgi:hypothetical protein
MKAINIEADNKYNSSESLSRAILLAQLPLSDLSLSLARSLARAVVTSYRYRHCYGVVKGTCVKIHDEMWQHE